MSETTSPTKVRERSKEYPLYDLEYCINFTEQVRSKLGNRFSTREQIASALGISEGNTISKVSSCKQYGLLELVKKEGYKPTDIFLKVTRGRNDAEKREALLYCIQHPTIYGDFIKKYNGQGLPTDIATIFFWDYKIAEKAKSSAADTFLQTLRFANVISPDNILSLGVEPNNSSDQIKSEEEVHEDIQEVGSVKLLNPPKSNNDQEEIQYSGGISTESRTTDIRISIDRYVKLSYPADISNKEIDAVIKKLESLKY